MTDNNRHEVDINSPSLRGNVFRIALISLWLVLIVSFSGALMSCKSTQPKTSAQHLELAQAFIKQGNFNQAYVHLSKALELNPQDPQIHENLSWLYLFTDKIPEAEREFAELKKLDPEGANTYYLNGALLAHMDKHRNALQFFQKARQSGYDRSNIFYDTAQSLMALNQDSKALLVLNQGLSRVPEEDTTSQVNFLISICLANYHLEQLGEAKSFCEWALEITPDEEERVSINNILHNMQLLQVMSKDAVETDINIEEYIKEGHDPNSETMFENIKPEEASQSTDKLQAL